MAVQLNTQKQIVAPKLDGANGIGKVENETGKENLGTVNVAGIGIDLSSIDTNTMPVVKGLKDGAADNIVFANAAMEVADDGLAAVKAEHQAEMTQVIAGATSKEDIQKGIAASATLKDAGYDVTVEGGKA